jgi:uncharacterized repeat protein (TIGR03803 family)
MMPVVTRVTPLFIAAVCVGASGLAQPMEKVVYSFRGGSNGGIPYAGLVAERGAFYGAADIGGGGCDTLGCGYVYKLLPPAKGQSAWTMSMLYTFSGGSDGAFPQARPTFDRRGTLYGTTTSGGRWNLGTVFTLTRPLNGQAAWTEKVLHQFSTSDGQVPLGRLIVDSQGYVYGTTELGGQFNNGILFRLNPPATAEGQWTETVLHTFTGGVDGGLPLGGLIADPSGRLYGTTMNGGAHGKGTVFRLVPPSAAYAQPQETVLHDFAGAPDGAHPAGGLSFDDAGRLYGQTTQGGTGTCRQEAGCGTVFRLSPPGGDQRDWTESVLYSFMGGGDGSFPNSTLAIGGGGTIYGATQLGGSGGCDGFGCGIIFSLSPTGGSKKAWTELVLKSFDGGSDGAYPTSIIVSDHDRTLVGTASQGGYGGCSGLTCGVAFTLSLGSRP